MMHSKHLHFYGAKNMVKDHLDSEREKPLISHGLLSPKEQESAYHGLCYTSYRALAGTTLFRTAGK